MEFKKYLETWAKEVEKEIGKILKIWSKEVEKNDPHLKPLTKAFIKSCEGGKRIRGVLVGMGYQIIRGSAGQKVSKSEIIKIAAAYEIFHAAILAHDDIIDQSKTRRGQPSLYQGLGGGHYGISQAICLADVGFFLGFKIISESGFEPGLKNKAVSLFSQTMLDTGVGQMLDIMHSNSELVAKLKTARYTIEGPLKLGAVLAGADGKLLEILGKFGENLGIAFQIKDDILDGEVKSEEKANTQALAYIDMAKKLIPGITKDPNMSKLLKQMGEYLLKRTK